MGDFAKKVAYPRPMAIAVADFNSDGNLDMVVANAQSNTLSWLLVNDDGTFGPAATLTGFSGPQFVLAAHFNRNQKPDLAVANFGSSIVPTLLGMETVHSKSPHCLWQALDRRRSHLETSTQVVCPTWLSPIRARTISA